MNSNEQFERDFERFVDDDESPLARLYRKLPQPEPDAQLDVAVRVMAHRAVATTAHVATRRHRWLPVLATAATIVLAAGIAIRMRPHTDMTPQSIPPGTRDEGASTRDAMPSAQPPVLNAPMASPAPAPQAMQAPVVTKPAPPPAPAASMMMEQIAPPQVESAAPKAEKSTANESRAREQQAFPAPSAPTAPAMRQATTDSNTKGRMAKDQTTSAATGGTHAKSAAASPYSNELMRNSRLYPESWIATIRRLIQAGHDDEARQNLDYFRKKHPDYQLPADLDQFAGQSR